MNYTPKQLADSIDVIEETYNPKYEGHRVRREAAALLRKLQWQPIETAPKDGRHILVRNEHVVTAVAWEFGEWNLAVCGPWADSGEFHGASHWIPLDISQMPTNK